MRLLLFFMLLPLLFWAKPQTTIVVSAGGDLQAAINAARCGDTIALQAGATFDAPSVHTAFSLPAKGCSATNPITIRSSDFSAPATRRIGPVDAPKMTRIRARGGAGAIKFGPNASHWIIRGIEFTNTGTNADFVISLIDSNDPTANNLTVEQCYLHPKETGSHTLTSVQQAISFEGSGLNFRYNYAADFFGKQSNDNSLPTTRVLLSIGGSNITLYDNFMQAWYTPFFTGGGTTNPQHGSTLTDASTTSAVYANVTGLSPGVLQRFDILGTATSDGTLTPYKDVVGDFNSTVITRTGGVVLVNFQGAGTQQGYHIRFTPVGATGPNIPVYRGRVKAVSGNSVTVVWEYGQPAPAGSYNWTMWAVAKTESVAGNVVRYTPYGENRLLQAPSAASWRSTAVVHTWVVTKNTIDIPYDYSVFEHAASGNSPKGLCELKDMFGLLFEGNHITGYPSVLALSNRSNEGATPWSTMQNLMMRNNFFDPRLDTPSAPRQFLIAQTDDYSNSATPGANIVATNNLIKGINVIAMSDRMINATLSFNTFINDNVNSNGNSILFGLSPSAGLTLDSNLFAHNDYGLNCQIPGGKDACWPGARLINNVVVNNRNVPLTTTSWGAGGIIGPIVTSLSQVGFVDTAKNDYRLSAASPYKGKGSGGNDPGVNWTQLVIALGFDPAGGMVPLPTPTATVTPLPTPTPTPSPSPTASATPQSSPLPIPSPSPSVPTPTPVPTPSSCTMTVTAPALPQWSSGVLRVSVTSPLPQSFSLTATPDSGQLTITPRTMSFTGATAVSAEFKLQSKKKSANVTVSGPCGSKTVTVLIQ